jgi:hypothetical protein
MPEPWGPLPFPTRGDDDEGLTYEGVGRVMTAWESIEFELSRTYSIFHGEADGPGIQVYGTGRIFQERLKLLREAGYRYFCRVHNQPLEGAFDRLSEALDWHSSRRNEVAHGVVFNVANLSYFMQRFGLRTGLRPQYLLIPPLYTVRSHPGGLPAYAYAYTDLLLLRDRMHILLGEIMDYRSWLQKASATP